MEKTCTSARALVITSNASIPTNMNAGYQMTTEDVKSPLCDDFACNLMSFCTVASSPDYQLKPARGRKTQMAYVVIADVLEAGSAEKPPMFLVESLEKLRTQSPRLRPST